MAVAGRRVRVRWDDPVRLEAIQQFDGEDDYGLYEVYSHHVVFGPGSLVYIGKAQEQTFTDRFEQHEREWLSEENDVTIR